MLYDVIIIGSGPAGMAAAIYTARRALKTLIVSKDVGGQLAWASEIENYPGFASIDSMDLIQKFSDHVKKFGVETKNAEIQLIQKENNVFKLYISGETLEAKAIIAAMGLSPRRLAIPGEEEFAGKGVSYCATCDGPFYKNKTVAVVGGGNSALDAAEMLSRIAEKVYLIHKNDSFRAFEDLVNAVKNQANIEIILKSDIKKIIGTNKVEKILVANHETQEEKEIAVNGVFIEIGRSAHTDLVKDLVERDEKMQIKVDDYCRTNCPGLFAAGDVTTVPFKQISIAAGQATVAALATYQYIREQEGNKVNAVLDRSALKKR